MIIELELTQDGHDKLARLREATGYSDQELFVEALQMLTWAADSIANGCAIATVDESTERYVTMDFQFLRAMTLKSAAPLP